MQEVQIIIFSKNRACQLELLLRSLNLNSTVLFAFDKEFEKGYNLLRAEYPVVNWVQEVDFRLQLNTLMKQDISDFVMFLVDDDVMLKEWTEKDSSALCELRYADEVLCASLRMSPEYKDAPSFWDNTWEWRGLKKDWGYPMSVTSTIFRKEDILKISEKYLFSMPNEFENVLKKHIPDRPLMILEDDVPFFINVLANQVQTKYHCNTAGVSLTELEEAFINGKRLSLEDIREKAKSATRPFLTTTYKYA